MNKSLEFNILGSIVRIKSDGDNDNKAQKAVDMILKEVDEMRRLNTSLKDIDVAVLCALKMASKSLDIEDEYKENVFALKSGIEDALNFVEEVSPGTMQV